MSKWEVCRDESGTSIRSVDIGDNEDIAIATLHGPDRLKNAALIAAAPDMLAVCREFINAIGSDGYYPSAGKPMTDRMRAAIAKAECRS